MHRILIFTLLCCSWLVHSATTVTPLPLEKFAKPSQFKTIQLSPDGKYFAATVPKEHTNVLVVIDRATNKSIIAYGFGHKEYIGSFFWANNERLIYTKKYKTQFSENMAYRGELFAANIDGSQREQLFGYSASKSKIKSKRGERAWAYLQNSLPNDNEHILVRASKWGSERDAPDKLYKINIYNQKRTLVSKLPLGNISVVTDANGVPIVAKGKDRNNDTKRYFYQDGQWQEIAKEHPLSKYSFRSISADNKLLYITKSVNGKTSGLYQYNFESQEVSLIFNHPVVDINAYIREPGSDTVIAIETMLDGIEYHYVDREHAFSKIHQKLSATFPNQDISIYANSSADKEMIIKVISDKNPGDFYLYNQQAQSVKYLLSTKPWIYPEQMNARKLIKFNTRDSQEIHGYLTLPNTSDDALKQNVDAEPYPLVVDVHGGPYGPMDKWHYDTTAQMLSNNGYAVLQINFRGSGGFGKKFKEVAYLKRSTMIQYDIIDGTKWALSLDNISDNNVCIMGGSFGGYSALMAPLIEPELYKCAIPMYGAYDLLYQMKNADYMDGSSVTIGAMKKYGDNEEFWRKESPLTYIDQLKTPLFIVTGGKDTRVPPENAFNLKKVLDNKGIDYQWLYKAKEGHGFVNPKNKEELYQKVLSFLDSHLNNKG